MRLLLVLIIVFLSANIAGAEQKSLAAAAIPAALVKGANAVVRSATTTMDISAKEVYVVTKYAVTILNEKGKEYAGIIEHCSPLRKVEHISGALYDKDGNLVQELKKKEVKDFAPYGSASVDDVRYKMFAFKCSTYPYTCEFEIESRYPSTMDIPAWHPQPAYDCAVEHAGIEVRYAQGLPLRFREYNGSFSPAVKTTTGMNVLTAAAGNLVAGVESDKFSVVAEYDLPVLVFVSDNFELFGNAGSMASWKDFGSFLYGLNAGRDSLPADKKAIVHNIADTCKNEAAKIAALYRHLQKNTRYVSIQLGVGGWQTLDAGFVAAKGYGDCKALSNYMKAMLGEAGITAYPVVIHSGAGEGRALQADFPHNSFNHVILCIPAKSDTIWLECTAPDGPAAWLSWSTADRDALMITPLGGFVVHTPPNKDNRLARKAEFSVSDDLAITGTVDQHFSDVLWNAEAANLGTVASANESYFNQALRLSSYKVTGHNVISQHVFGTPYLDEHISVTGEGSISRTGAHLFLSPDLFRFFLAEPVSAEKRTTPFAIPLSYTVRDTIVYHFTGNYSVSGNKVSNYEHEFASFSSASALTGRNTLVVTTSLSVKKGIYAPEKYAGYIAFYRKVKSDIGAKIVLTKLPD
ncbi:MAG: DUF3857 domain-containing protein [Bacteroidota bacterium]